MIRNILLKKQLLNSSVGIYITTLLGGSLSYFIYKCWHTIRQKIISKLYTSVTIPANNQLFDWISIYLQNKHLIDNMNHTILKWKVQSIQKSQTNLYCTNYSNIQNNLELSLSSTYPLEFWWEK